MLLVAHYNAARRGGRDLVGRCGHSRLLQNARASYGVDANHRGMPIMLLREVLTDQSDRGHRASVSGWGGTFAHQNIK